MLDAPVASQPSPPPGVAVGRPHFSIHRGLASLLPLPSKLQRNQHRNRMKQYHRTWCPHLARVFSTGSDASLPSRRRSAHYDLQQGESGAGRQVSTVLETLRNPGAAIRPRMGTYPPQNGGDQSTNNFLRSSTSRMSITSRFFHRRMTKLEAMVTLPWEQWRKVPNETDDDCSLFVSFS